MNELKPRQWEEGEEAAWIADKVCILGDYGKDAARVLRKQVEEVKQLRAKLTAEQAKSEKLAGQAAILRGAVEILWNGKDVDIDTIADQAERALSATESDVEAYLAERDARAKNEGYVEAMEAASSKCYDLRHWDAGGHFKGYSGSDVDTELSNAVYSLEIEFDRMAAERKKKG